MTTETEVNDVQYEDPETPYETDPASYEAYRSVSKAAVLSFLCAFTGLTGLVFPALLLFAFSAIGFGLLALRNIRRYPDELTGKVAATVGLILGSGLMVGGTAMHSYIYATEVPPGYERISFNDLETVESAAYGQPPQFPTELDGKRIFVKGYVHPGVAEIGELKTFVLVPDMGTCCFGGQPDLTDMIEVKIVGEQGVRYSRTKRKLAGTFKVSTRVKKVAGGLQGGYYSLEADYVK